MPRMSHRIVPFALSILVAAFIIGCSSSTLGNSSETPAANEVIVMPLTEYTPKQGGLELIQNIRKNKDPGKELHEIYHDLTIIDIHNHDADNLEAVNKWGKFGIDRIVLFGAISEPIAQITDHLAWTQYQKEPSHIYPSFAGVPIYEEEGLSIVREKLEQGYLNIGEIAAASTHSPVVSKVKWKAEHPNDGNLPQIYDLAAKYRTPVLLHIDPPNGAPIMHLEEALEQHPDTIIIFGHANAYNSPINIETLLAKHPNLYIDFFAGFTAFNNESANELQDFIPLMEQYPDKFMLSTDSG